MKGAAFVAFPATIVFLLGTACTTTRGSGNVVTQEIDVSPFSKLEVSSIFTVRISTGASEALTVRVDDNVVDRLDVGVHGDTLRIGLRTGMDVFDATLEADVTVTSLESIVVSGASRLTFANAITGDLAITVSGASVLTGGIEVGEGSLELSGASKVTLSGSAERFGATISGASNLDAAELAIERLEIDVSGASRADVNVTGSLSAGASGASSIRYAGSPSVDRSETSGASSIAPAG